MDLQEFAELLQGLMTRSALTEAALLLSCLGLSWLICWLVRRVFKNEVGVLLGYRLIDGVLFPVLALLLALLARYLVTHQLLVGAVKVAVFKIAIPILISLAVIRLTVRVLSAAFPASPWVRVIERSVSWLAWGAMVLWITGVLPTVMREFEDVSWKIGSSQISLRTLIEGSLTAAVVMMLVLWVSAAIEKKIIRGQGDDLSTRKMIANILRSVLLFIGLLVALSAVGIDLTALSVLGGAVGVGVGFGLQKIAANYVSGFVVLAERSLRIGDMVKVDNFEGRITDIRTRYTVIRSLGGRESIVPNEMLITQRIENASLADPRVLITSAVQVAYGTDVRALQPQLVAVVKAVPRVLADPAPAVQLAGFGADGLDLIIQFWISDPENGQGAVKSEVNLAVLALFNTLGVEIPYPQRVLHGAAVPSLQGQLTPAQR
jgi:small-conductance mechanosensitive channel